jgi:hypothetical protein
MNLHPLKWLLPLLLIPVAHYAQTARPPGVVIHVDDVKPATEPYNVFDQQNVLEQEMSKTMLIHSNTPQQLIPSGSNSFIQTIHLAYAQHHDLVLSPDDIWIQIALGVSIHINEQFDRLNAQVLNSPEKEELFVRMDDLANMEPADWQRLIDTFAILAKQKIKPDFYRTMLPEFSTSTAETRTVLNAILLSTVKKSLLMHGASGCGIPNVVLLGKKEDWQKILLHLDELAKYDLQFWTDELKPIIQECVNAFDGKANPQFWQCIYKYRSGYMLQQMNGWASKFYPYFRELQYVDDPVEIAAYIEANPEADAAEGFVRTTYFRNPYLKGDDYLSNSVDLELLPASVCSAPLIWSNLLSPNPEDHEQHLELYAGFAGTVQLNDRFQLQNNPVWYIVREDEYVEPDYDNWMSAGQRDADFMSYVWSDSTVTDPKTLPVYHPEKNATTAAGMEELKAELRSYLKKQFPGESADGTVVTFVVSHFGSCFDVQIAGGTLSEKARIELLLKMKKLSYAFQPATVAFEKAEPALEVMDEHPEYVQTNSRIPVKL